MSQFFARYLSRNTFYASIKITAPFNVKAMVYYFIFVTITCRISSTDFQMAVRTSSTLAMQAKAGQKPLTKMSVWM